MRDQGFDVESVGHRLHGVGHFVDEPVGSDVLDLAGDELAEGDTISLAYAQEQIGSYEKVIWMLDATLGK